MLIKYTMNLHPVHILEWLQKYTNRFYYCRFFFNIILQVLYEDFILNDY